MAKNVKEMPIPASQMQRGTVPLDPDGRKALRLKIEAEITRHENAFEEVVGGGRAAVLSLTPTQLHDMRRRAIGACDDTTATAEMLEAAHRELTAVTFGPPVYGDQPKDAANGS